MAATSAAPAAPWAVAADRRIPGPRDGGGHPGGIGRHPIAQNPLFWLALKLLLTAGVVVTASIIVERAGPLIGALVVTLPVTVWPAYLFLSLDHDPAYLAASAGAGLAVNAVSGGFMLLYLVLAQKRGVLLSLGAAVASWIVLAAQVRSSTWTLAGAGLLNLLVYPLCIVLSRRYREVRAPRIKRLWYELPLRTALVCSLMAAVLLLSRWGGPGTTGMLAVYPISTTCTMLILHSRLGGKASAAVIANALWGLAGLAFALLALALSIGPWGVPTGLALLLAVSVSWNLSIWLIRAWKS